MTTKQLLLTLWTSFRDRRAFEAQYTVAGYHGSHGQVMTLILYPEHYHTAITVLLHGVTRFSGLMQGGPLKFHFSKSGQIEALIGASADGTRLEVDFQTAAIEKRSAAEIVI